MLYYYLGDTSKARTNVITFGYEIQNDRTQLEFAFTYSSKQDIYNKYVAKDIVGERFRADLTFTVPLAVNANITNTLIAALYAIHKKEWFNVDSTVTNHPMWAHKMIKNLMSNL